MSNSNQRLITVLLVDDDPDLIELVAPIISRQRNVDRILKSYSAEEAKFKIATHLVHVVLTDIAMPNEDGISLISYVNKLKPRIPAIAFTALGGGPLLARSLHAGARGFLLKTASDSEYEMAIDAALRGATYISSELQGDLQRFLRVPSAGLDSFKEREREIANLVKAGMTNQQIASACGLSVATVKKYVSSILRKTDTPSRSAMIAKLMEADLWQESNSQRTELC